jgi:hypothetical protein
MQVDDHGGGHSKVRHRARKLRFFRQQRCIHTSNFIDNLLPRSSKRLHSSTESYVIHTFTDWAADTLEYQRRHGFVVHSVDVECFQ